MKQLGFLLCACALLAVTACGGGGGGDKGTNPPAEPSVSVAITTPPISTEVSIGENYQAVVTGTWTGTNLGSNRVYLQISDNTGTFVTPVAQLASGSGFTYGLPLESNVAIGQRNGTLTVRACKDSQCAQPYAGASATLTYQLRFFEPSVAVAITSPAIAGMADANGSFQTTVTGTWSSEHLGSNPVYLQVGDSADTFKLPAARLAPMGGAFDFALPVINGIETDPRSGLLTVRACRDALCTQPYADAVTSVGYQLTFPRIAEWETHQRNSAHNGYVPITLDPAAFAKVWEWQRPPSQDPLGGINEVVTSNGSVYVGTDVYHSEARLYSLAETTGQVRWNVSFGTMPALNPPAINNGRIYISTTGHEDTYLWAFAAVDGSFRFKMPFASQWQSYLAPTIYRGQVYTSGGYYANSVYAYDRLSGAGLWQSDSSDGDDVSTPAVDKDNVYQHTGAALMIWNRMSGEAVANIADPFATSSGYSYHSAPMLGGRNNVVAFAGSAFSGRAGANVEQYDQRMLSSFSINNKAWEWTSRNAYLTQPAVANGVIYAARNAPTYLDAIDEATGTVLWSWTPAPGHGDTEFHRNIVVTDNLLFVSTNASVYAIDLATRMPVWRYPAPGMLAISANRTLYIATGARESDGKLVAVKLK